MAPQSHPRAQFIPITPDLDLADLVENTSNFDYVTRLPNEMLKEHSIQSLEQLVLLHVVIGGKPLVIEGWDEKLHPKLFSPEWLQDHLGKKPERVRDIPNEVDIPMTVSHYLKSMKQLANQFTPSNFRNPKRQRLYLKDIDTPEEWAGELKGFIPEIFFYLNDCIESRTGGDGAILERNEYGQMRYGKGVAPAGDLMSSLPPEMRALNMMCYIGHEGTYTSAHREMCASLGHNIMVEASKDEGGEKAGSSIWFMTETKEREVVSEYFLSMLGHDIEVEKHFAQINAWKKAPFNVWVVEQKVGDLILIPPLAPHQVWNRGTRTMKAAWNRTTVDTLELAIHEALPRARMVCRDEQYKNKAIIYYTLIKYNNLVQRDTVEEKMWKYGRIKQLFEDFKRLLALFTEVLVSEMFSPQLPSENDVEFLPFDSNVTCSYCRCNIWNRFLTCKTCIEMGPGGEEDTYDICMDCYAMGRSCGCISDLKWVEQWEWSTLEQNYEMWRNVVVRYDGYFNVQTSPQPLEVARKRYGKKPVAQICQEQLKLRPWQDIKNPTAREPSPGMSDVEPEVDDEGRLKKKKGVRKYRGRVFPKNVKTHACHVCCHHHENWKQAFCTTCSSAYCYGVLWRAFDLMPQQVMEDRDWSCPKCLQICSCGKCRKNPTQTPYAPKGTLLGHDTRKVADFRSVESLVDFSKTNLGWLRGENDGNPQESTRMKKLREKAEAEKAREDTIDENYLIDHNDQFDNMEDIDPQLRGPASSSMLQSNGDGHYQSLHNRAYPDMNDVDDGQFGAEVSNQSDSLNGLYDVEIIDAYNRGAITPSKFLAPVSPMVEQATPAAQEAEEAQAPEQSYPEQPQPGQNRMMGIGYYQQQVNSKDKILYDVPASDAVNDEPVVLSTFQNPNFALSDLIGPEQEARQTSQKRKHGSDDEDDTEFFTSKRQRKLAEARKHNAGSHPDGEAVHKAKAPPRRSVPKPQTYTDLGEEALPYTEDDIVPVFRKKKVEREDGDLQLATQATSHLEKKPVSEKSAKSYDSAKRTSLRGQASSAITPPAITAPVKLPRKSTWLARKEAEEAGEEFPPEIPRRRGRRLSTAFKELQKGSAAINISSDDESDDDGGSVQIDRDHSLFSDFDLTDQDEKSSEGGTQWRVSDDNPKVRIAEPLPIPSDSVKKERFEKPAPKRRGRPSKQPLVATKPSPPTSMPRLLSLKDKLALKGKPFKIVGPKSRKSNESPAGTSAATSTATIVIPKSVSNSTPLVSPIVASGWNSVNRLQMAKASPKGPQVVKLSNGSSSIEVRPEGPTIPSDESAVSRGFVSNRSFSDDNDDDDDESIPPFVLRLSSLEVEKC